MTLGRKLLLLSSAVAALVALSAPAAAQAAGPYWHVNGAKLTSPFSFTMGNGEEPPFSELKFDFNWGVSATCGIEGEWESPGSLKNGAQQGEGTLEYLSITECWNTGSGYTTCEVMAAMGSSDWPMRAQTGGSVSFGIPGGEKVAIVTEWNNCGKSLAIPDGYVTSFLGNFSGGYNNANGCFEFSQAEGLTSPSLGKMRVSGTLCLNEYAAGPITLN